MREYLNLEFHDIQPSLSFDYSLEHVIDDFILLAVFVGNDFLPNLPDLHIHENGLERLFEVYKKVLPAMGGYLNDAGSINTQRLQMVLGEMEIWEREVFEREYADLNWYKGKQTKFVKEMENARNRSKLGLYLDLYLFLIVLTYLSPHDASAYHFRRSESIYFVSQEEAWCILKSQAPGQLNDAKQFPRSGEEVHRDACRRSASRCCVG